MFVTKITEDCYTEADEENLGFCISCKRFTTSCCEPDARKYECEECGKNTVYGAEEALIMGVIDFSDDESDDD